MGTLVLAAALAALMGACIQRGATCFVAAMNEIVADRRAHRLVAILEAGLVALLVLTIVQLAHGPLGLPEPPDAGWRAAAGGALLGVGAFINGACVFGAIARIGNGELAWLGTPLGFYLGAAAIPLLAGAPMAAMPLSSAPLAPLPAAPLAILPAGAAWLAWRIAASRKQGGEPILSPRNATVAIGICFAGLILLEGPWAWTDVVGDLAVHGAAAGLGDRLALVASLFGGSVAAGLLLGRFRPSPLRAMDIGRTVGGGALMGAGGLLTPGSNDGLLLLGVPMLSLHALVAIAAMGAAILACEAWTLRRTRGTSRS
jgi:toxin CptA